MRPSTLEGVPVFNLPIVNPSFFRLLDSPFALASPNLPNSNDFNPTHIFASSDVPVVKIIQGAKYSCPNSSINP